MKRFALSIIALLWLTVFIVQGQAVNLALNKTYSASSTWSNAYAAKNAFDGNAATRWSAEKDFTSNQWVQVDFGTSVEFDRVVIKEYGTRVSSYQIQVSDDGKKWLIAAQGNIIESDEVMELLAPQKKRYLRFYIISALKEPGLYEIGVFNKVAEIPKPILGEGMYFEDPRGPLTKSEVDYFKAYTSKANKFPLATTNVGNQLVYGKQGIGAEGLAWMYKTTGDRDILDLFIKHCDYMLNCRNDQQGGEKRVLWTGRVEKCWPNKDKSETEGLVKYSASENGDILGHIYFCSYLILLSPDLLDQKAPVSDKKDYIDFGTTYRDRALKYIQMCDEVMDEFYVPRFVTSTYTLNWPDCPEWNWLGQAIGYRFPVNQQAMALNAFHKALECYGVLGIRPEKQELYKKVVQTSIDGQAETLKPVKVTVNGETKNCYLWYYHMDGGSKVEDFDHSSYGMLQYYKAYESDLFENVTLEKMHTFINTVKYIMWDETTRTVSDHVNGAEKELKDRRDNTLPGWIQMSYFDPDFWEYNLKMRGNVTEDVGRMGHFLYMKSRLFGYADDLNARPINITRYGEGGGTAITPTASEKRDVSIAGPVKDVLNIVAEQELKTVRMVDLSGRTLLNQPYEENIPVSHLPAGIYVVFMETAEGQVCAVKIVKE
ncbi:discoidin domain-containing protein [Bacteroides salyersiae]|uniref:discoidin domain-containing protein n=1 Tax=Bacteroides salyersiae TaxID=291644 RepID=UPI001C8C1F8D|nr:discoidin domain-containing protein [Bacteroides salyersiae]